MLSTSRLQIAETEEDIIKQCDVIFILIQTPSKAEGDYDHSFIDSFVNKCVEYGILESKKTLVISSTVMPEYTDSVYNRLKDYNYDVCYNPTFIAQGSIIDNLIQPNLVLIGSHSEDAANIIKGIHEKIIKNNSTFHTMTPLEAEITKMTINCFITSKIAFANMIGDLLKSKNIEPFAVLKAVGSDSRIGNKYLSYGYGFGGPCFPRDNRALNYYANTQNFDFKICKTTDELNRLHLIHQFNELKDSSELIEFTYITYKDTSDILEESQKLKLAIMLADHGCKVLIKERKHIIERLQREYGGKFNYECL